MRVNSLVPWLERQIEDFKMVKHFLREHDGVKSDQNMKSFSELWLKDVRLDPHQKRDKKSRL